jgi:hypothetical protein
MSFKKFDNQDVIVSADSISSTVWSTGAYELATFFTSSTQEAATSGDYYLDVFDAATTSSVQYSIAYGEKNGLGSTVYNSAVSGKSPSATIYGQYRSLVLGDEESDFSFGGQSAGDKGIWAISVDRSRYKEKLLPGTFNLVLNDGTQSLALTDNSQNVSTVTYNDAGRVYDIVQGTNGSPVSWSSTGYTTGSYIASFGKFLPDVGVILLNGKALTHVFTDASTTANPSTGSAVTNGTNNTVLHNLIKTGASFKLNGEETISSNYVFVRVRNSEFNYSNNPSNITGSGELRHNTMVNNPQAYITSVGLYNDNNDLLGVAKLSRPLLKDFTKEALIRIKLDY